MRTIFIALVILGCGINPSVTIPKSVPCTVLQSDTDATITCPDGSTATIANGKEGKDGTDGVAGQDGKDGQTGSAGEAGTPGASGDSCNVLSTSTGAEILCSGKTVSISNGTDGTAASAADGKDGTNGTDGINGVNGTDGVSCKVEQIGTDAHITCGDSIAVVSKGDMGEKGEQGETGAAGTAGPQGEKGVQGEPGKNGIDGSLVQIPLPNNLLYFYGFVCNNIPVIGTESVRFLTYDNKVFILTRDLNTIWSKGHGHCKVSTNSVIYNIGRK